MFCIKMRGRIKRMLQQFDSYVDEHTDTALRITLRLQEILKSPVADIVTTLIPGNIDNLIRQHLLIALEHAADALLIAQQCNKCTGVEAKLKCLAAYLAQCPADKQEALLQKLASLVAGKLDGGRMKQRLYDLYTQAKYALMKENL